MKSDRVEEYVVRAVPEPEWTTTWHPMSHAKVIDALQVEVANAGFEIVKSDYDLSKNGLDMFGTWELNEGTDAVRWMMGVRNSLQKKFPVGVTAGDKVMVCSNMAFSGDHIEFRKHTSGLDMDEMRGLASRAVATYIERMRRFEEWHEDLKTIDLPPTHFKVLTYNSMAAGVLPPSNFQKFLTYHKDEVRDHGDNVYAFHGAHTRLARDGSLMRNQSKSKLLNRIIDDYTGLVRGM